MIFLDIFKIIINVKCQNCRNYNQDILDAGSTPVISTIYAEKHQKKGRNLFMPIFNFARFVIIYDIKRKNNGISIFKSWSINN